jgi:hypothetical protein
MPHTSSFGKSICMAGLVIMLTGCSFSRRDEPGGASGPSGGGSGGAPGFGGGTPTTTGTTGGGCLWSDPDRADCSAQFYGGKAVTPDIFVMFDESGSMAIKDDGVTMRIDAVRDALVQFLDDSATAGMGVGIGYFGTQPLACACTSCNPSDYATPVVPIAPLPGQTSALVASLRAQAPTGETPTGAALRGSCAYASGFKRANPGREVVVLLVTDGEPQAPLTSRTGGCTPTLADAIAAASECLAGGTPVRTYVLGVGPSLQNLDQIAAAGGTVKAHLVENGGGAEVLAALEKIRTDASIPCSLQLPQPTSTTPIDLHKVNVVYADAACTLTTLANVDGAAACDAVTGGWYYDSPDKPSKILLCDASCKQVAAPGSQLQVSLGCPTIVIP